MRPSLGAQKLTRYLDSKSEGDDEFGARCRVGPKKRRLHRTQVHAYRTGRTRPGVEHAVAIEVATARRVLIADWAKPPAAIAERTDVAA